MNVVVDLDGGAPPSTGCKSISASRPKRRTCAANDRRADDIVKGELLARMRADHFKPGLAIDDRRRVVDMWRSEGIVCAQVAEGDF